MKKPLCFIDIETTGLNSAIHEIIEIAIIKICPREGTSTYTTKIQPENIQHASPEALEINGYSQKDVMFNYIDEIQVKGKEEKIKIYSPS